MMSVYRLVVLGVLFVLGASGSDVYAGHDEGDNDPPVEHTAASLRASLLYSAGSQLSPAAPWRPARADGQRKVGLAFGLSAVVPGLGQAYNRQWIKAVAGFAVEAAVITGAIVWKNQGDDLEYEYQQYAHAFWNPAKYANWLNDYSAYLVENFDADVTAPSIVVPAQIDFSAPENWSEQEWGVVLDFFGQIRTVERQMFHVETLAAFSHTLPDFSEQQYYELVGKYYQFAPGWSDYPVWREGDEYTAAIDPSMTGPNDTRPNVPPRFFQYAEDHAHANDVLRRASRVTTLLIATHFIAAIEAAVSAKLHNDRIVPSMEIGMDSQGNARPKAVLTVKL